MTMKKDTKKRKLVLTRETVHKLTNHQLAQAIGGLTEPPVTHVEDEACTGSKN